MSVPQKLSRFRTLAAVRRRLADLGIEIGLDDPVVPAPDGPLARPLETPAGLAGNRLCVLPMEGWDATADGRPSDLTRRRWRRFGRGGAKLVWGGEAVAVREDGRANPHQLVLTDATVGALAGLREALVDAHVEAHGDAGDLVVGLQLTHSGRFACPAGERAPRVAYRHPLLDVRVGVTDDAPVLSDAELDTLVDDFVRAAVLAQRAGFAFVDVKHCHGYLLHELLSARGRPGPYGGDLASRTRFLARAVEGIRAEASGLAVGVRLSAFDFAPFRPGPDGIGAPECGARYDWAFGGDGGGTGVDLREVHALLDRLEALDVRLLCVTAGSPYYSPHVQRPAFFPPSDGYAPPEDPLVGVARLLDAAGALKRAHPALVVVGSGYSYLQEWLPHAAQHAVRTGAADAVGLGRVSLSYPDLPADVLAGRPLDRRALCRTFSDCTTAPRNGLVSGCYPLDPFYRDQPAADALARAKRGGAA